MTASLYVYSKSVVFGYFRFNLLMHSFMYTLQLLFCYFRFGMNLDTGVQDIILRLAVISSLQVSFVYMFNINIKGK